MDFTQIAHGLEKFLADFEETGVGKEQSLIKLYDELAYMYHSSGMLLEAEKYYLRALVARETEFGTNASECLQTLHRLGVTYRVQNKFEQAEYFYNRAFILTQLSADEASLEVATRSNYMAGLYLAWGRYRKAKECLDLSLKIYRGSLGEDHLYVGFCLIALAIIEFKQQEKEKALICLDIAEGIIQPVVLLELAPSKASLPALVASLSLIYLRQMKVEEAEVMFRFALIQEACDIWPAHPSVGAELKKLAQLYKAKGRQRASDFLNRESERLTRGELKPEDPEFNSTVALVVDKSEDYVMQSYDKSKLIKTLKTAIQEA